MNHLDTSQEYRRNRLLHLTRHTISMSIRMLHMDDDRKVRSPRVGHAPSQGHRKGGQEEFCRLAVSRRKRYGLIYRYRRQGDSAEAGEYGENLASIGKIGAYEVCGLWLGSSDLRNEGLQNICSRSVQNVSIIRFENCSNTKGEVCLSNEDLTKLQANLHIFSL